VPIIITILASVTLLRAFEKLRKAAISFVLSVTLSIRPSVRVEKSTPTGGFS
jgi:hypothetical protein